MRPGRKEKLTPQDIAWLRRQWSLSLSINDLMCACHISKPTLYRYADIYHFGPRPNQRAYGIRTGEASPIPTMYRCEICDGKSIGCPIHPCHLEAA